MSGQTRIESLGAQVEHSQGINQRRIESLGAQVEHSQGINQRRASFLGAQVEILPNGTNERRYGPAIQVTA